MRNQPSDGSSTYSGTSEWKVYLRKDPLARYGSSAERKHRELFILGPVLIGLSVLLAVGWYLSRKEDGFNTPIVSQSVLTYAPTAVMLLIISLWRQVDYHCKTSAPWDELTKSPVTAARSVLLDYISTFQVIGLLQSIRNRHVAVVLGILGFVLLKAATIASTGLLVLAPKVWTDSRSIVVKSRFDGSLYNSSDFTPLFDQSPVYTAYGVLANGLEYPFGSSSDHAYATFSWPDASKSTSSFEVTVEGLFPMLQCKHADVSIEFAPSNTTDELPDHNIMLSSTLCDTSPGPIYALNPAEFLCPSRQLSGTVYSVECGDEQGGAFNETWKLLTLTDIRYAQSLNTSEAPDRARRIQAFSSSTTIAGMTSILCKLSYKVGDVAVSGMFNDSSQLSSREVKSDGLSQLDGFSNSNLSSLADMALRASSNTFGTSTDNTYAEEYPNVLFKLMASQLNGSYAALFDEAALIGTAQTVFEHVAVQVVGKYLRRNETTSQHALVESVEETVHISEFSVWIMIAAFLATICAGSSLVFYGRKSKCGSKPSSMLACAILTSRSGTLRSLLLKGNAESGVMLRKRLQPYSFYAVYERPSNFLSIAAVPTKGKNEDASDEGVCSKDAQQWWTQLSTSRWFIIFTFCYAIALIATLEVLQRLSNTGSGITDVVSDNELWRTTISHYIPALVAILLATMFNCLDFNVLLLDPFNRLKSLNSTSAICHGPSISQCPLSSFYHAVLQRRAGALGSSSAAFVGGLLTIIVSGLYTVQDYPTSRSLPINATDLFQARWPNSVLDDGGAAISTSLVENLNLSFPRGTWDEIAVPLFEWQKGLQDLTVSPSSLDVEVPMTGLRAKLVCEAAYAGGFSVSISRNRIQQSASVNSTYPLPPVCQLGGPGGNLSTLQFRHTFNFALNQSEAYIAKLLDLHVGPYDDVFGGSQGETLPENNPDNPAGCPSIALIYGYLSQEDLSSTAPTPSALSVQVCYQHVESLSVNTTFEISNSVPRIKESPQLNESSARQLFVPRSNNNDLVTTINETAFQFRVQKHFDTALAFFNNPRNPFALSEVDQVQVVDRFFQGALFGRNNLSISDLKIVTPTEQARMFDSIHSFYRRYMAQAISSNMRVNITTLSDNELDQNTLTFEGQIVRGLNKSRLVQHETSKWILQSMISFMVLGGILAVTTTTFNKLLPASADPCTIWGQMSLWAGSRYCDELANSTDQATELSIVDDENKQLTVSVIEEMVSTRNQSMLHFRLGWWPNKDVTIGHPRARYGIDEVQA